MLRWIELYYRASRLHHSLCCIFSPFNGSLLLLFSSFSLDVIQVLPIILPFKKNLECYDSSFLADDPGVRVVNKSPGVGGCVCVCTYINMAAKIITLFLMIAEMLESLQLSQQSQCQVRRFFPPFLMYSVLSMAPGTLMQTTSPFICSKIAPCLHIFLAIFVSLSN